MNDIDAGQRLTMSGSFGRPLFWLFVISVIAFSGIAVALWVVAADGTGDTRKAIALVPIVFVCGLLVVAWSIRRSGVRVEHDTLVVNTGTGTKRVAIAALRAHGLRVVDLSERTELQPVFKLWGTGLPGFAGGWFRLRNGDKAVCLLLDRQRVSWLRSDADRLTLLLSLAKPEKLRALLNTESKC
ncbi:MAG: hypothetical protein WBV39_04460 [Rudaea sp.]